MAGPGASLTEKELVLLGLIAEEPMHAYGLEEKIRVRRMAEWTDISFSSIYRVLSGLQKKGWIDTRLEHEGQGATRKVHSLNVEGRARLSAAVLAHLSTLRPLKNPFQVGLAFSPCAPLDEVLGCLRGRRDALRHMQDTLAAAEALHEGPPRPPSTEPDLDPMLGHNLVFEHVRCHLRAEAEFLDRAEEIIEAARRGAARADEERR